MSSENNEKENQVLSFVTHAGLGIFMVVVAVVIYTNMKEKDVLTPPDSSSNENGTLEMPEVKILSSEEVSNERFVLERVNEINEREKAGISIYEEAPARKPVEVIEISTPPTPAEPAVVEKIKEEQKAKDPATTRPNAAINGANKSPVSKPFSDFANMIKDSPLVSKSVSGYVVRFNYEHNFIVVDTDGGGNSTVRIDERTQFKINGKNITVNDIKIGDKITVSGKGYDFTDETIAETVSIVGSIKFY